jgi:hypothetical protein
MLRLLALRYRRARVACEPLALRSWGCVPPRGRPPRLAHELDLLLPPAQRRHPRRLVCREIGDLRIDEDQRPRPLRVRGGEQRGDDRRLVCREDRDLLRADCAQHRKDVVREHVDVRNRAWRKPLGAAPAAPVCDNHAGVAGEPAQEAREVRALPVHVDGRAVALQIEQVRPRAADDLIRERDLAVPGVPRLGTLHGLRRRHACRRRARPDVLVDPK